MLSGEPAFIGSLRALATHPAARGLADDCAVLDLGDETLILTHDMMVEGIHYLPDQDMADVAWKLVATNMSDLAAKGAQPLGVLLGYMLGDDAKDARFVAGLHEALYHFNAPLLGGDTSSGGPPRSFGLTAIGKATHRPVPSRAGANAGDILWITGPVGGAMIGFEALKAGDTSNASRPYRRPDALLADGQALARHVTAMMDVSDGLLLDATRLAPASAVTIAIDSARVPIAAPEARRNEAMRWGDDYQLLFTLPPETACPVPATPIGTVIPKGSAPLLLDGEEPADKDHLGYLHR